MKKKPYKMYKLEQTIETKKLTSSLNNPEANQAILQPNLIYPFSLPLGKDYELIETRKLTELLSSKSESEKKRVGKSNLVDLYYLNKKYLKVYVIQARVEPADISSSYTTKEFDIFKDELIFKRTFKCDTSNCIKVILLEDTNSEKYALKRCWINLAKEKADSEFSINPDIFLMNQYKEFGLVKLYNACPYSAKPKGFHIVYISNMKIWVTEMLTAYAGEPLSKHIPAKKTTDILEYFRQILHAGNFLEAYRIEHNDIKTGNFLIELITDNLPLIKLIDFDIGINQSQELTTNKGMGYKGHTNGYVAPEIILILRKSIDLNKKMEELRNLNSWKCHAYSIGIVMIQIIGLNLSSNISEIDKFKEFSKDHDDMIINKLSEFSKSHNNDILLQKIIFLITKCILYDSEQRGSAKEILELIDSIETDDFSDLERKWLIVCKKREDGIKFSKPIFDNLNNQLIEIQKQNLFLQEERKSFTDFIYQKFIEFKETPSLTNNFVQLFKEYTFLLKRAHLNEIDQLKNLYQTEKDQWKKNTHELNLEKSNYENELKRISEIVYNDKKNFLKASEEIQSLKQNITNDASIIAKLNEQIKEKDQLNQEVKEKLEETILKNDILKKELESIKISFDKLFQEQESKDKILKHLENKNQLLINNPQDKVNELIDRKNSMQKEIKQLKTSNLEEYEPELQSQLNLMKKLIYEITDIIKKKGYNDINVPSNKITEIIENYLPEKDSNEINPNSPISFHTQNYDEKKKSIMYSGKISRKILEKINDDIFWDFVYKQIETEDIRVLSPLIIDSSKLEFIYLMDNDQLDKSFIGILAENIYKNNSLKGILLFLSSIPISDYEQILLLFSKKNNLICFYVDKEEISYHIASELSKKFNLNLNQWKSK